MSLDLTLIGDVNLMGVTDPTVPFARVQSRLRQADLVIANLECLLAERKGGAAVEVEGFFADPVVAVRCLEYGGIAAVGLANNVNFGADAIAASIARLDAAGIVHAGAGSNAVAARAPFIVERKGLRIGFLQRSAVYWATNHEAGKNSGGIAVIRGHTAYQVPMFKMKREIPPLNRPGIPPYIVTWTDPDYLAMLREDIAALRGRCDVLVLACHWGLHKDILQYMTEIAHTAIDCGADIVVGHGPHYSLAVETYKGRPIFYGLGSFSFHTGHGGHEHDAWIGMMVDVSAGRAGIERAAFQFIRRNAANETYVCDPGDEPAELADIRARSEKLGSRLRVEGDRVIRRDDFRERRVDVGWTVARCCGRGLRLVCRALRWHRGALVPW